MNVTVTKVHKYADISCNNQESEYSWPSVYPQVLHPWSQPTADWKYFRKFQKAKPEVAMHQQQFA